MLKVKRGDETRLFTAAAWKEMPPHKYGWKPVVQTPPEVLALLQKKEIPQADPPPPPPIAQAPNPLTSIPAGNTLPEKTDLNSEDLTGNQQPGAELTLHPAVEVKEDKPAPAVTNTIPPAVVVPEKRNVNDTVKLIQEATTIGEVNALCPEDEDRITIRKAADYRIKEITGK